MNVRLVSHSQPTQEFVDSGIDNAQELIVFCARVSDPANQFNTETSERLIQYLIKYAHWEPLDKVSACAEITTTRSIARQILRHRSEHYARAIDLMIGKEQAGDILLDDAATRRLHMNGTLRSWIHIIELKGTGSTQKKHQLVAMACAHAIAAIFPIPDDLIHELPKNFCIAPFTQLTTHPNGSFSPCPYLGGTVWSKQYSTIIEQFQGKDLEDLREQFLSNQKSPVCERCWHEERNDKKSLRLRLYDPVSKTSDYSIIENRLVVSDLIQGLPTKKYLTDLKILTIKNGNVCNAKCRVCHPGDSSRWAVEDAVKLKKLLGQEIYNTNSTERNWTDQQCDEIFELSRTIVRLELFGGEPLYNKKVLRLLDRIAEAGHSANITLYINTNGSVDLLRQVPRIAEFKEVEIGVSIDDIGKRFDYQRHGLEYNQVVEHVKQWQEHFSKLDTPFNIDSITTVNIFNVWYLPEIEKSVQEILPRKPFWNLLVEPDHLFIKNLPDSVKQKVIAKLNLDSGFEEIINVLSQPRDPVAWETFIRVTDALDTIRNENFQQVFPEFAEIINLN